MTDPANHNRPELPKILVVDDEETNLVVIKQLLAKEDAKLVLVSSGQEALEACEQHDFALVLLDVIMPGMDGFELARQLSRSPRSCDVPLIFITATATDDFSQLRAYRDGAVDFLIKPFDAVLLQSKVRVFLELSRQKQQLQRLQKEHEKLSRLVREHASQDNATGLSNRHNFLERVEQMSAVATEASPGAVLLLDVGGYRDVAEGYGHGLAEKLLHSVGGRLANAVRDRDLAAHLDGGEFVVLMNAPVDQQTVHQMAFRIRERLQAPFDLARGEDVTQRVILSLHVSFGIAFCPTDGKKGEAVMQGASRDLARRRRVAQPQAAESGVLGRVANFVLGPRR